MSALRLRQHGETREVRLDAGAGFIGQRSVAFERRERGGKLEAIVIGGRAHRIVTAREGDRIFVWCDGAVFAFERARGERSAAGREHGGDLVSPMPGRVRKVLIAAGEKVVRGQVLLVLEAMKMEHAIRAPRDGAMKRLLVREGDLVDAGVELAEME